MLMDPEKWARLFTTPEYGIVKRAYNERLSLFEKALAEAKKAVAAIRLKHLRKATLRIAYIAGRVKSLPSLIKKACDRGISATEVFDRIHDVVGLRVVVNNATDVAPLIEELRANPRFKIEEIEDHAQGPYRAVHLKVAYGLRDGEDVSLVQMEIQIRTLLQDAWAILTHHDVYKNQAALPALAQPVSKHLSESLSSLDKLADEFRRQMENIVEPPNDLSDDARLDRQGIAFLYYEILGEKPQEYEVDILVKHAHECGLRTIGDARRGLGEDVLQRLRQIHDARFGGWPIGSQVLEYGFLYAAQGPLAFEEYRKLVQAEWEDIERTAQAEALSEMPETFDEFVADLKRGDVPWGALEELGGVKRCSVCGTKILDPDAAAEGVMEHYEVDDADIDILALICGIASESPFEPQGPNFPDLCSWCDHTMSKDD